MLHSPIFTLKQNPEEPFWIPSGFVYCFVRSGM